MKAPRRLTWPALRSEIVTGILGLLFIPAGVAMMPRLASEVRAELSSAKAWASVLPSTMVFVPVLGLLVLGVFFVLRTLRRRRLLAHGIAVDFELAGGRRLLGFPVRWRFEGREHSALVDLPVTLSPVPEEPASDAMLLIDPERPERCIAARRGMFRHAVAWQSTAARIASTLSRSEVALPPEVSADLRVVPEDDGEAKAWVSVVDRHLGTSAALERWLIGVLPALSPEERRAMCKLSCVRRIDARRTRRIKAWLAFVAVWAAYLAAIGSTGEVLWTTPVLGAGPLIYVLIGWLGVEER